MVHLVTFFIFFLSIALVFHSYVLFPWMIQLLARIRGISGDITGNIDYHPDVVIVFSVYNEENIIHKKMESLFVSTYPKDKIHIYVGSDNSTDNSDFIIQSFAEKYSNIHFYPFKIRQGKSGVLNSLLSHVPEKLLTEQTVLILTDANVIFTESLLQEIVKQFKNTNIGQVGANVKNVGLRNDGISVQEAGYIHRETKIKTAEGFLWGTMMGAFGACYAIRGNLWVRIPKNQLMEDFFISMHVLKSGYKAVMQSTATCIEDVSNNIEVEIKRKERIQAGNLQNLFIYWPLLFRFNTLAFCFWSHKVLRWFTPIFIIASIISNVFLLELHSFFIFILIVQVLMLFSPLLDYMLKENGLHSRWLRYVAYFYSMNYALVRGYLTFVFGIESGAWKPTIRNINNN